MFSAIKTQKSFANEKFLLSGRFDTTFTQAAPGKLQKTTKSERHKNGTYQEFFQCLFRCQRNWQALQGSHPAGKRPALRHEGLCQKAGGAHPGRKSLAQRLCSSRPVHGCNPSVKMRSSAPLSWASIAALALSIAPPMAWALTPMFAGVSALLW